jgi:hypothetical protein
LLSLVIPGFTVLNKQIEQHEIVSTKMQFAGKKLKQKMKNAR